MQQIWTPLSSWPQQPSNFSVNADRQSGNGKFPYRQLMGRVTPAFTQCDHGSLLGSGLALPGGISAAVSALSQYLWPDTGMAPSW
jgi:hypothetical protein